MQLSLDLDDLMLFHAVVECGSLTAASNKLGVPRATLSRRLLALEKNCGAMLKHLADAIRKSQDA